MIEFVKLFFTDCQTFVWTLILLTTVALFVLLAYKFGNDLELW